MYRKQMLVQGNIRKDNWRERGTGKDRTGRQSALNGELFSELFTYSLLVPVHSITLSHMKGLLTEIAT